MILKNISKSLTLLLLIGLYSCSYDGPVDVFNPNESGGSSPEIIDITPSDFAIAKYTKVKITGKNFASGLDTNSKNIVYFNNKLGTIISESQTEIIVVPPNISGEDITIKISVPGAFQLAEFNNYKVELLSNKVDAFLPIEKVLAIAVDSEENLFGSVRSGNTMVFYKVEPGKDEKYEFGTARIPVVEDMKIGPNNELYFVPGNRDLYKVPSGGGEASSFVRLPKNVKYFDFDFNKNIYLGGSKTGIFRIATDTSISEVGNFKDFDLKSLRIFDGHVYFSANYAGVDQSIPLTGVWKSEILTDGDLAEAELVFDWNESGSFAASKIGSITLASDGSLFIGCDAKENPIVLVRNNGNSEALYSGLLFTNNVQFVWGNSNILYHNVVNSDNNISGIYKVLIAEWESAPYYGRN
jgi:hypothetical protein